MIWDEENGLFDALGNGTEEDMDKLGGLEDLGSDNDKEKNNNKSDEGDGGDDELFESQEGVAEEVDQNKDEPEEDVEDMSSPNYASIAKALAEDGVLDLDNESLESVKNADDLIDLFKKQIDNHLDETQKRIKTALETGVPVDEVQGYEKTLNILNSIKEDDVNAETEDGENLRRQLIYQDYINRGFKPERAKKEADKSVDNGTDKEDALEALESSKDYFKSEYDEILKEKEEEHKAFVQRQKKEAEDFKNMVFNEREPIAGITLDKKMQNQIYETATKAVAKDENGNPMTALQRYAKENKVEYNYKLNLLYTLTDGFKDIGKVIDKEVNKQSKKKISNLEKMLKSDSSSFSIGGSRSSRESNTKLPGELDLS